MSSELYIDDGMTRIKDEKEFTLVGEGVCSVRILLGGGCSLRIIGAQKLLPKDFSLF